MDEIFKKQVFELVNLIPKGRVTTYGAIAKALGYPRHSRHVGKSLHGYDPSFPAHRVCNSAGHITASCATDFPDKLRREHIEVVGNKIVDFRKLFWDPIKELE